VFRIAPRQDSNLHHRLRKPVDPQTSDGLGGSTRAFGFAWVSPVSVAAMLDAYAGQDGQTRLTLLSTWLGHVHPASTYWYLSASPETELMAAAGQRLGTHLANQSDSRP
jgi:hypothetical protein